MSHDFHPSTLRDYDITIENDELIISDDNGEFFQYTVDIDKAKALLTEAGFPDGFDATFEIASGSGPDTRAIRCTRPTMSRVETTMSLQLKALLEAGVVGCRPEGQQRIYHVRREALGPAAAMLEDMWGDALWQLKAKAELEQARRGPRPRKLSARSRRPATRRKR